MVNERFVGVEFARRPNDLVITGLDPVIHLSREMDARIKSAHDT